MGGQPGDGRAGWRMATLDAQLYPESARAAVRNTPQDQALCYAGGAGLPVDHGLNPVEQARREGLAHACLPSGACTHIVLPDEPMRPATIAEFVRKIYVQTRNRAVLVSGAAR